VGGGLGGGSANAAAVLRALEGLCPTPLGMPRLLEMAGTLGADVPFLVSGQHLAWAWGRGDRLLPLPALPSMALSLVTFREGVNTAAAYGAFATAREQRRESVRAFAYQAGAFGSWSGVADCAVNDFEQVVSAMHAGVGQVLPQVQHAAQLLRDQGHPAVGLMSGSGATCFVLHPIGTRCALDVPDGARVVETVTSA
jgi:4-diphosphocytidyl-2-C-methyl-D-erythritol kinase